MSEETIICHGCGAEVPSWMRFHWITDDKLAGGHYTTPDPRSPQPKDAAADGRPAHIARAAAFFGEPPHYAPAPGDVPPKPWLAEEELRANATDLLETLGYEVSDLEQGWRGPVGSRVRLGLPDMYVTHAGLGVRAWIEYKRWDGEPTDEQRQFGAEEIAAGGCYLVVYETAQLVAWHEVVRRGK